MKRLKLLTIFIAFTIIFSCVSTAAGAAAGAAAEEAETPVKDNTYAALLTTLGINVSDKTEEYATKGEFAALTSGLEPRYNKYRAESYFSDLDSSSKYFDDLQKAYELGLISGDGNGNFNPNDNITLNEAVKILTTALGYKTVADFSGGYPTGYMNVAYQLNLLNGVKAEGNKITYQAAVKMVYNALFAYVMDIDKIKNGETVYLAHDDKILLNERFDIYYVDGIVTAFGKNSLKADGKLSDKYVSVQNLIFKSENFDCSDYVGYKVRTYYYDNPDTDDKEVKIMFKSSKNIQFSAKNDDIIRVTSGTGNYEVRYENGDKSENILISKYADIIYNGRAYVDYDLARLCEIACGNVDFISNDGDDIFDVVIIKEYRTAIVESVNDLTGDIYLKNNTVFGTQSRKLQVPITDKSCEIKILDMDGIEVLFSDLSEDYVISIAKSSDNSKFEILVTNKVLYAQASEFDKDNKKIYLNDKEYTLSADSKMNDVVFDDLLPYYLNYFDEVVYVDIGYSEKMHYGYAVSFAFEGNLNKTAKMRVFTEYGKMEIVELNENVKVNNVEMKSKDILNDKTLFDAGTLIRQLISYKEINNKIKEITCAIDRASDIGYCGFDEEHFSKDYVLPANGSFRTSVRVLDHRYMLSGKTIVFMIPENKEDHDSYIISDYNFYSADTSSLTGIEVYDSDSGKVPDVLVVGTAVKEYDDNAFLVNDVSAKLIDGTECTVIRGYEAGVLKEYTLKDSIAEDAKSLSRGDVLIVKKFYGGILEYKTVSDLNFITDFEEADKVGSNQYGGKFVFARGIVEKRSAASFTISVNGNITPAVYPITSDTKVFKYNGKMIEPYTAADISVGARILVHRRYDAARLVIIYDI